MSASRPLVIGTASSHRLLFHLNNNVLEAKTFMSYEMYNAVSGMTSNNYNSCGVALMFR